MTHRLGIDTAELRLKSFIPSEKFPYRSVMGWVYDSGNYAGVFRKAMEKMGYGEIRREQEEKRKRGELMGICISCFTEIVGEGPSHTFDILSIRCSAAPR